MKLSILIVSRTPELISNCLTSISTATTLTGFDVEILCSWNGDANSENEIQNGSGYTFLIAQREPYHFASNMNKLMKRANGDLFLLLNDDIELDPTSIDAAITCLEQEHKAGLMGARLRHKNGKLAHAGILFDPANSPYHALENVLHADDSRALGTASIVPAITGAFLLGKRSTFEAVSFSESYKNCGEDIELCLDIREKLGLEIYYCPSASGIHESESTRSKHEDQSHISEDLARMRSRYREFIKNATSVQIQVDLNASKLEAHNLRILTEQSLNDLTTLNNNLESHKNALESRNKALDAEMRTLKLHRLNLDAESTRQESIERLQRSKDLEIANLKAKVRELESSWLPPRLFSR